MSLSETDAPPRRRSLFRKKVFFAIFDFARARFFLLKGKENFFAGLCPERAGRRGFASARARRNSPHTPLPLHPRLGWQNFLRRAYNSINVFKNLLLSSISIALFGDKISLWIVSPSNCVTPLEFRPDQCFNKIVDLSKST